MISKIARSGLAAVAIGTVLMCCGASAKELKGLPLADMIRETKIALLKVQEKAEVASLPPLSTAVLELNTVQEVDASGGVKFLVIELGGGPTVESSSTIKVTLVPPPPGAGTDVATVQLAERLAEGILAAARSLAEAGKGKPPLVVSELVVAVKFGLVRAATGGLSLQFPPFEVKAGAKIKSSEIQTVTVKYALPEVKK